MAEAMEVDGAGVAAVLAVVAGEDGCKEVASSGAAAGGAVDSVSAAPAVKASGPARADLEAAGQTAAATSDEGAAGAEPNPASPAAKEEVAATTSEAAGTPSEDPKLKMPKVVKLMAQVRRLVGRPRPTDLFVPLPLLRACHTLT